MKERPLLRGKAPARHTDGPGFESRVDIKNIYYFLWPLPCFGRQAKPLVLGSTGREDLTQYTTSPSCCTMYFKW